MKKKIKSGEVCHGVQIMLGRAQFTMDFYILLIEGYEVVLEALCLCSLGSILLEFLGLLMKFHWRFN